MKYIIYPLLLTMLLVACTSSRHAAAPIVVHTTDSIHTEYIETVKIDTVTVFIKIPQQWASNVIFGDTSHLETDYAESDAWFNPDGSLGHSIRNKDKTIPSDVAVPSKHTENNRAAAKVIEVPIPYPVKEYVERDFTWWETFRLKAFWYLAAISILSLGLILKKVIYSIHK